jgi:uncharacterized protein (TIGR03437 family)
VSAAGGQWSANSQVGGAVQASAAPVIPAGAALNAASFARQTPLSPGGLIALFGANLTAAGETAASLPLPSQLASTTVSFGGQPMPLLYANTNQINGQVPFELSPNTRHQLVVMQGQQASVPQEFVLASAQPGIFTVNAQGTGQGLIMRQDQVTLADAAAPAARGETVVIYGSGLGQVTPAAISGHAAPSAAQTINPTTVTIGAVPADVLYSGLTPGAVGLYQVNARVPVSAPSGIAVPVNITVAGQTSNTVTMAIQ